MIEQLNNLAEAWLDWMWPMFWQVCVLVGVVWVIDLLIRRWAWPQVRYALWLLILAKLILPPTLTSPTSFTAEIPFLAQRAVKVKINQSDTGPPAVEGIKATESATITPTGSLPDHLETTTDSIPAAAITPPTETAAEEVALSRQAYVFFVWLAGIAVLSGWLILRLRSLRREQLDSGREKAVPDRFKELLEATAKRLNLRRVPRVIFTERVCCPAIFGLFSPALLMPVDKLRNLTRQDAEHILLHELAHIKRGDLFVHAVYVVLQIAYWFNPLLWFVRRQLQHLRELGCDATVARLLKEKTFSYRDTLLNTARQLLAEPVDPGLGLLGLFEDSSRLAARLRWLERKTWKYRWLRVATVSVIVATMFACVLPMGAKAEHSGCISDDDPAGQFRATLASGVTVELVGVCEHPSRGKHWWRPDGTPFDPGFRIEQDETLKGQDRLGLAVKLDTNDFNLRYKIEGVSSYYLMDVRETDGRQLPGYRVALARLDDERNITNVRLGVATSEWQTIAESDNRQNKEIVFSAPIESKRGTAIAVRGDWGFDGERRIIAIDKRGDIHKGYWHRRSSWSKTIATTEFYDLRPDQIQRYQLQFRPYEYVEYKNVSLKPNLKTDVQIEIQRPVVKVAERAGDAHGQTSYSLPNIFVMSPQEATFNASKHVISVAGDWVWNRTGRHHHRKSYDEIFDGTRNRTNSDVLVLLFALDSKDRVPPEYEDLLPQPWSEIEKRLEQNESVELLGSSRGLNVILLAARETDRLPEAIAQSEFLNNPRAVIGSAGEGADVSVEDFRISYDSKRRVYRATVSIRNNGQAPSPKFIVNFYLGDPENVEPMTHGAGPIKPGEVWNEWSGPFGLNEGINEITVVLDPANLVDEPNEQNNSAVMEVTIKDGQIVEKSVFYSMERSEPSPGM